MVLIYAIGFILVAQYLIRRTARVDGFLSPIAVAALSIMFYAVVVPLELWLRGETIIGFTGYGMTEQVGETILLSAIIGLLAIFAGYALVAPRSRSVNLAGNEMGVRLAIRVAMVVSLLGVVLLLTVFRANVVIASDYLSNVSQTALGTDAVGYFVVNRWTYLTYGLFCFLSIARSRRPIRALLLLGPLLGWAVLSNDKDPLLIGALAASGLMYSELQPRRDVRGGVLALVMVIALAAMAVGAAAFGIQRAGEAVDRDALEATLEDGLFINIDPAGPAVVLSETLEAPPGTGSFRPALTGLLGWLPTSIRPTESTEDLAITFARHHWPNWEPGYGYGFSPIAEGWLAAGYAGVLLLMLAVGAFFGFARNVLLGASRSKPASGALRIAGFHVVLGYLAFTVMRGTVTSLLSTAVICFVLLAGLSVVANVAGHKTRVQLREELELS